jgi:hypothetical protein
MSVVQLPVGWVRFPAMLPEKRDVACLMYPSSVQYFERRSMMDMRFTRYYPKRGLYFTSSNASLKKLHANTLFTSLGSNRRSEQNLNARLRRSFWGCNVDIGCHVRISRQTATYSCPSTHVSSPFLSLKTGGVRLLRYISRGTSHLRIIKLPSCQPLRRRRNCAIANSG